MNKNRGFTTEILFSLLAVCYVVLVAYLVVLRSAYVFIAIGLTIFVVTIFVLNVFRLRHSISRIINGAKKGINEDRQSILSSMTTPVLVTDRLGKVLWYNAAFSSKVLSNKRSIFLEDIVETVDEFDSEKSLSPDGLGLYYDGKHFNVYSNISKPGVSALYVSLFIEDTEKNRLSVEFQKRRPSIVLFMVDNYDEVGVETGESERSELMAIVNRTLENFINATSGVLTRISSRSYFAVIEEQHITKVIEKRFEILDEVRSIPTSGNIPLTLSIGVGRGARTYYENYLRAKQALDMSLGRGGDQAALKTKDGYDFFGGVSRAVEKRNKVKSRIIGAAFADLIKSADNLVVMGHKMSDLDSLGACVGVMRIAKFYNKQTKIVFDPTATMALPLYDRLIKEGYGDCFVSPSNALDEYTKNTLAVVVDCHTPAQLDRQELINMAANIVVIDHHRKMVNHIDNAVLFYHEAYTSSCCEMVTELLQALGSVNMKPTKVEAIALMGGIMLDTKNFSVRTGVRTFDAAAYLRKLGADSSEAKLLFATGLDVYLKKTEVVSSARMYKGCAIAVSDNLSNELALVIPQAADDLLSIEGTKASIVAVKKTDKMYRLSARSFGEHNVQLIMELMGGGGNQMMAGAEVEAKNTTEVIAKMEKAIDEYLNLNN